MTLLPPADHELWRTVGTAIAVLYLVADQLVWLSVKAAPDAPWKGTKTPSVFVLASASLRGSVGTYVRQVRKESRSSWLATLVVIRRVSLYTGLIMFVPYIYTAR